MTEGITPGQFHEAAGVEDWRVLGVPADPAAVQTVQVTIDALVDPEATTKPPAVDAGQPSR